MYQQETNLASIGDGLEPTANGLPNGIYSRPLPCLGCGIGWLSFLLGFLFPPLWYYAGILYLRKYYLKDPRERIGLAASAIAALICSAALMVSMLVIACKHTGGPE